jgi:phospholipid/cholesterol/gamma-HCH transport system permease protein
MVLELSGRWHVGEGPSSADEVLREVRKREHLLSLSFDCLHLTGWDSGLLVFLRRVLGHCGEKKIVVDRSGLPKGVVRLLDLSGESPETRRPKKEKGGVPFLSRIGETVTTGWSTVIDTLGFLGDVVLSFSRFATGRARFRFRDLWVVVQDAGVNALPIVSLISVLVGLILAFVGSVQLRMFGAQIYIADLVGVAMVRAMGAIMTGIIMAGRTGASYAARLGTMQVNEEIDALRTAGISPVDFLVLPRVIALGIMMPLLTIYADVAGIAGGLVVSVFGFGVSVSEYYNETLRCLTFANIAIGLFSSLIFGILVGFAGCLKGLRCGRSASAVGDATTSAVVSGIISIIVATALITIVCNILGLDNHA